MISLFCDRPISESNGDLDYSGASNRVERKSDTGGVSLTVSDLKPLSEQHDIIQIRSHQHNFNLLNCSVQNEKVKQSNTVCYDNLF